LDTDLLTIPGPRLADGVVALEKALHGRNGKSDSPSGESPSGESAKREGSARDAR
jgi:hypothetical protein